MTLSDQIDELRQRMMDEHALEMAAVQQLDEFLQDRDLALMQALRAVLEQDERRQQDIVLVLHKLATRIGALPMAAIPPLPAREPLAANDMPRVARPAERSYQVPKPPPPPRPGAIHTRQIA